MRLFLSFAEGLPAPSTQEVAARSGGFRLEIQGDGRAIAFRSKQLAANGGLVLDTALPNA